MTRALGATPYTPIRAPSGQSAREIYNSRIDPTTAGGGNFMTPYTLQNRRVDALVHKISGVPNLQGGIYYPEVEQAMADALVVVLDGIQSKMDFGMTYDDALESFYVENGSPPIQKGRVMDPTPKPPGGGYGGGYIPPPTTNNPLFPNDPNLADEFDELGGDGDPDIFPGDPECPPCWTIERAKDYGGSDVCVYSGGPGCNDETQSPDDSEEAQLLEESALFLDALSKVLSLTSTITDAKLRADFERAVKDAQQKMIDGQRQMTDASRKIGEASQGLAGANNQINTLSSQLSTIQNQMAIEMANITNISSAISGINSQLSSASSALASAQSRYSYAQNRANYPSGSTGLTMQRNDLKTANTDIFNINSKIADLQNTRNDYFTQSNISGDRYNNLIPQANAVRDGVVSAYNIAGQYDAQLGSAMGQFNGGAGNFQQGYKNYVDAGKTLAQQQRDFLLPQASAKIGVEGASKALNQFSLGNNFSASAEILNSGFSAGVLNSGAGSLAPFSEYAQGTLRSAGNALDAEIRASGGKIENVDLGRLSLNFSIDSGNRFLGVKEFQNASVSIGKTSELLGAGDTVGATLEATTQAIPSILYGTSTILQTASPLFGPMGAMGAQFIPPIRDMLNALQSGVLNTMAQTSVAPISVTPTPSTPRGIGRGLVTYPTGTAGQTSGASIALFGSISTAYKVGEAGATAFFRDNRNIASDVAGTIYDIARNPANWPPQIPPGTIRLAPEVGGP